MFRTPKTQRLLDVTDRPGAPQSTIYVGLPVADPTNPDNIPLTVTNALLGGSFGSRITANIREQKGYTYSPTQPAFAAISRCLLGGNCRRDHRSDRAFAQGNFWRDRSLAKRSRPARRS